MPNDMNTPPELLKAEVSVPQPAVIAGPAERLLASVRNLAIDSDPVYEAAASDLAKAKAMVKAIEDERMDLTRPLDELKAKIMDKYRPAKEVCAAVIALIEPKMLAYRKRKQEEAEAERRRQEELARLERERLEREAAEARRKAEEEAAAARRKAQEEAQKLAAEGRAREAEEARQRAEREAQDGIAAAEAHAAELQQTAAIVVAAPSSISAPRAAGTSVAGTYKGRVVDKQAFIAFVAKNPMYADLLDVNQSGLNAMARSLRKNLRLDGIEAYLDESIRSRAA
jgi:multidrug efflux pump subunit AcrA (membrane-fusion protein)